MLHCWEIMVIVVNESKPEMYTIAQVTDSTEFVNSVFELPGGLRV